ncbi:ATP synthase subunit b, mitochondrial [Trachymyrmex septentrionalis]|uniref:ATP synthase subunit b n=1 Tax=Trachymyrmex septentrionalis TaxID=34720 RepID=A0A195ETV7_9HYME|nr:ATP synthase subunit b, mitochondrial [Trachymyrmex septentrionalis]
MLSIIAQLLSTTVRGAQSASSVVEPTRPKRLIDPSPVRHGFIPEEWFQAFYPKTGASGPYAFAIGLSTYLISKEIYVMEHEYYNGLSLLIICIASTKIFGPKLAQILDKEISKYENDANEMRNSEIKQYENLISHEKNEQSNLDGQKMIIDIKKENVKIQLEATYRERLMQIYQEVKKRLDYQVQIQNLERRIAQKNMVQWIVNEVLKSITPEQEKATLHQCIKDLEVLAAKV